MTRSIRETNRERRLMPEECRDSPGRMGKKRQKCRTETNVYLEADVDTKGEGKKLLKEDDMNS